ncbi:ATP-dependent helicase [Granulicoccus phenolivorans]|uniref:ATP-dependent helicase n=1 Tax=Granulicoccus phenolivorans TaxID=266854 RepID=UPI00041BD6FB|nr:ATP-dependent DNA helicase [Granulicoccus phenolivorans]
MSSTDLTAPPRTAGRYQLLARSTAVAAPRLDEFQQQVVDHAGGPLLVLAGPGTGKTTTLVESVVARVRAGAAGPDGPLPLVLTFSRRAAADLRRRIAARLGAAVRTPQAMTFHSFCFALLRRFVQRSPEEPMPRLLTAPEQDFRVREVLSGAFEREGSGGWPPSVEQAYHTRAFAQEVRAVFSRARMLGMDAEDLIDAGRRAGRGEWVSVGTFMDEYLEVLDFEGALDYAELVHRCRLLLADPENLAQVRDEIDGIWVDEYQDTDPSQIGLLRQLVAPGDTLVAFGDPHQSIYAFRGAQGGAIADFATTFGTPQAPAPTIALGRTRRFGRRLAHTAATLANRLPQPSGLAPDVRRAFGQPMPEPTAPAGEVRAYTYDSEGAQAEYIADLLRRAYLREGFGWDEMAVLVRSGRRSIPGLSRALSAAGVPIEVAGDEIALSAELAVRPLLLALDVVRRSRRAENEEAAQLLLSPLGGLDSLGLRRLGRSLREAERREHGALPPLSDELIRLALLEPERFSQAAELVGDSRELVAGRQLAELLQQVEQVVTRGGTAEEALWTLWAGTEWPRRLRTEADAGGDLTRRADRDLDAICALFAVARRSGEVVGTRGLEAFLAVVAAQQIPADTQREADVRGQGVRVMTAHRAKGLEWRLVVVASVQEGSWPDLRRRGSLLEADRLGPQGLTEAEPPSALLAEERRLFYVACTRARERLVVTAVSGTEGEGDQPSRFLTELGARPVHVTGRPARPLTLTGLVGELRRVSVDPQAAPALRDAAAVRLAMLADAHDDQQRPLVGAADPKRWWGLAPLTHSAQAVQRHQEPVRITGSSLEALLECPRRWFLQRRARGEAGQRGAASKGTVLHTLIEYASNEQIPATELADNLDLVWDQLDFPANYLSATERVEAETALERFTAWEQANDQRRTLGNEVAFTVRTTIGGESVELGGTVDRLALRPDGKLVIVDYKTGRVPRDLKSRVPQHPQLGLYQLAATHGAFADLIDTREVGAAELVYLSAGDGYPTVATQASLAEQPHLGEADQGYPSWADEQVARAARIVRSENFVARRCTSCSYCPFRSSCPVQSKEVIS